MDIHTYLSLVNIADIVNVHKSLPQADIADTVDIHTSLSLLDIADIVNADASLSLVDIADSVDIHTSLTVANIADSVNILNRKSCHWRALWTLGTGTLGVTRPLPGRRCQPTQVMNTTS